MKKLIGKSICILKKVHESIIQNNMAHNAKAHFQNIRDKIHMVYNSEE